MLKHRLMSGFLIATTMYLIAAHAPPVGAWVLIIMISTLGQLEFYAMAEKADFPVFRVYGTLCGAALISATFCTIGPDPESIASCYKWENVVLLMTLIVIFVRQFFQKKNERALATIACTLLGVWYVPFLFNYFTRLAFAWDGADSGTGVPRTGQLLVLYLVVVVKMADVGAYFVGRAIGKHKLFYRITPGKTWEGLFGGVVASIVASWVFFRVSGGDLGKLHMELVDAMVLGVAMPIVGVVGDMFESLVKRACSIKDSSETIPGMGGVLDVVDSLLFGAPVLYVYACAFLV